MNGALSAGSSIHNRYLLTTLLLSSFGGILSVAHSLTKSKGHVHAT